LGSGGLRGESTRTQGVQTLLILVLRRWVPAGPHGVGLRDRRASGEWEAL